MTLRLRYVVNVDAKQGLAVVFFNKIIIYIVKTFQTAERQYAQCFNAVIELKKKKNALDTIRLAGQHTMVCFIRT